MSLERTKPSIISQRQLCREIPLHSSNICIVSRGKGRRLPISGSPANTLFMCLVNSVRSSSLIVCDVLELDPCTVILCFETSNAPRFLPSRNFETSYIISIHRHTAQYLHVVLQLYSSRSIDMAFLQGCANLIVGRSFTVLLYCADDGRLVNISLSFDIDLSISLDMAFVSDVREVVGEGKDILLLELRILAL